MTRIANFIISGTMLKQALGIPEETEIVALFDVSDDAFLMVVKHPDLREVLLGERTPRITPIITRTGQGKPSDWLTWDWNNKEAEK